MLVRIKPADARLGMFLHAFEGRFSDRPFWQTHFVLSDPADLERLKRSAIEAVIVDTDKTQQAVSPVPARKRAVATSGLTIGKTADPSLKGLLQTVGRSRREVMKIVEDVRLGRSISVARLAPVLTELSAAVERNAAAFLGILRLKARDEYTYLHSVAVSALMMNFARTLGMSEREVADLGMAGLLHDVGKITMPSSILNKPDALTADEYAIMRGHPEGGEKVLRAGEGVPAAAFEVCLHHHERIDGRGYPHGLAGDGIGFAARMGAICDVYDALTSHRPYKSAWSPQQALSEMLASAGQFDAALLQTFIRSLGIYPVGTLVRLRDTSLCVVVADNAEEPTLPIVRSFWSIAAKSRIWCEDVRVSTPHAVSLEDPADWDLGDWMALKAEILADGPASGRTARAGRA